MVATLMNDGYSQVLDIVFTEPNFAHFKIANLRSRSPAH